MTEEAQQETGWVIEIEPVDNDRGPWYICIAQGTHMFRRTRDAYEALRFARIGDAGRLRSHLRQIGIIRNDDICYIREHAWMPRQYNMSWDDDK